MEDLTSANSSITIHIKHLMCSQPLWARESLSPHLSLKSFMINTHSIGAKYSSEYMKATLHHLHIFQLGGGEITYFV